MRKIKNRLDDLSWRSESDVKLEIFLRELGISRNAFIQLYKEKLVLLDGKPAGRNATVHSGEEVRVRMPKEEIDYDAVDMPLDILFEDEDMLILNKPAGITVNSQGQISVANGVAAYFKKKGIHRKVRLLNRLDMNTQGCLVIVKSPLAQAFYQKQIEDNRFMKTYVAEVEGVFFGNGMWEIPMGRDEDGFAYKVKADGKMTKTAYQAMNTNGNSTFVEVSLLTGKTHQIRVAFAHAGHPLVGDELYGGKPREGGFFLQAKSVSFISMRTGDRLSVEVPAR